MVTSPAVLSAQKKKSSSRAVSFAQAVSQGGVAGSSKIDKDEETTVEEEDAEMGDNDEGEWRTSTSHPSAASAASAAKESADNDEEDDAVMIDPNSLLPPSSSTSASATAQQQEGLLKFPALSAKEAQGKIETQLRKVSVSPSGGWTWCPTLGCYTVLEIVDTDCALSLAFDSHTLSYHHRPTLLFNSNLKPRQS